MKYVAKNLFMKYGAILLATFILVGWAVFFRFFPVDQIIDKIGIENSYLAAFLLATVAGFSSITGTSLYAAIIALAEGGVNPVILGIVSGIGLFLSDSAFFYIIHKGKDHIAEIAKKWETFFKRLHKFIKRAPDWLVYTIVFVCVAFLPVPNDILLAVLAVSGYRYKQFFLFLLAGDITMTLMLTLVTEHLS